VRSEERQESPRERALEDEVVRNTGSYPHNVQLAASKLLEDVRKAVAQGKPVPDTFNLLRGLLGNAYQTRA